MRISFLGAANAVTGSRHLVEVGDTRVLLDCGLFQGYKTLRERNWAPLAVSPASIDAVVLSHAHLDHSGWLPALVTQGFKGPIYASAATCDLAEVLLLDSAYLQEEDARRANRGGWTKHQPAKPLYTVAAAQRALGKFVAVPAGRSVAVGDMRITLAPAGHLLGAMSISLSAGGRTLVYSGDLGRSDDLMMPPPVPAKQADVLLIESTYGNRRHPVQDVQAQLGEVIRSTVRRGGSVLLPSFAVGRAQALMLVLQRLKAAGEIPADLPLFLDSPMATKATAVYQKHHRLLRIPAREAAALTDGFKLVASAADSAQLVRLRWPRVVISASGMATGGRVLFHLAAMAPQPRNAIVFPGFQVGGTRGAKMIGGATEVKIHGQYVAVKAAVSHMEGFSGHADADALMDWLRALDQPPQRCFVVHGEPDAADALRLRIQDELGWRVSTPDHGTSVDA